MLVVIIVVLSWCFTIITTIITVATIIVRVCVHSGDLQTLYESVPLNHYKNDSFWNRISLASMRVGGVNMALQSAGDTLNKQFSQATDCRTQEH